MSESARSDGSGTLSSLDWAEVRRLIEQLARAESELTAATAGRIDSIIDPIGQTYLLREAQQALLRSEAAAKEQAALLGAIIHNAPDLIAFLDRDGRIRFANMAWMNLSREDLIGADWFSLQLAEQRDALRHIFDSVVTTGQRASWEGPGPLNAEGASGTYSCQFGPVSDGRLVVGAVLTCRETTAQKIAEAQLLASERMASVGILAAGVAHEINNPLTTVISNIEFVQRSLDEPGAPEPATAELIEQLGDARIAADRVRRIVRDLRLFSRGDDEGRRAIDVEQVLDSTLRLAANEIRHRAKLVREYGHVPPVMASESRLGQVFLNLLVNAAQAIPDGNAEGNTIRIATRLGADQRVHILIADTGSGIPNEIRSRLFTPFCTTKPAGSGTGLGLSICHRIVTSLGGSITFESEVGRGTEFHVALPVAKQKPEESLRPPLAGAPHSASRRGRILVIDDELAICTIAKLILSRAHDVVVVSEAPRALEMLRQGERFDLILCDVMIPQMTGIELYQETARFAPEQADRFVFMTGGTFTARAQEFLGSCANYQIDKPFDVQSLQGLVDRLITAGSARKS